MKILIVGYGSIGKRHAQVLGLLYPDASIAIVSSHQEEGPASFGNLGNAGDLQDYDYFVISSETASHREQLGTIDAVVMGKKILVEKPLFHKNLKYGSSRNRIYVGYNLRYHPLLQVLHQLATENRFLSVNVCVGQYLPNWRPGSDYRLSYSASIERGGGVLLDLSHELDYLQWIFGPLDLVKSCGGRISRLEIRTEDYVSLVGRTVSGVMEAVSLDYLSRIPVRRIHANADNLTCVCDLVQGKLQVVSESGETSHYPEPGFERNSTYAAMHTDIIDSNGKTACTLQEGMALLAVMDRIRENMEDPN